MAISFVGSKAVALTSSGGSTAVSLTDLKDASGNNAVLAKDDLLIIAYSRAATVDVDPAVPFNATEDADLYSNDTNDANLLVWRIPMGATPDTSILLPNKTNTGQSVVVTIHALRGVDLSSVLDVAAVTATGIDTGRPNPGSATPVTAGAWIYVAGASATATGSAVALTNPGDLSATTNHFQAGIDNTGGTYGAMVAAGLKTNWASGAFDPSQFTGGTTNVADSWAACTLVLKPSAGITPTKGRITLTGKQPVVVTNKVSPGTGHLVLTGKLPVVVKGYGIAPFEAHLRLTGYPPGVTQAAVANTPLSLYVPSGATGTSHAAKSRRFRGFTPLQAFYLSFFYKATRTTGSGLLTLTARINWYGSYGPLTPTQQDITLDATVGSTFTERQHIAPAGAIEGEVEIIATPDASPMQHDLYVSGIRLGLTERAADVTSVVTGPSSLTVETDSAGVLVGSSPYATGQFKLVENGSQVTSGVTWTATFPSGVTGTLTGSGTGTLQITGLTVNSADVVLTATKTGKAARQFTVTVAKDKAAPPTGGAGGGTSASQTSGFTNYSSGTAAAVTGDLDMTGGTSGNVTLAASLSNEPGLAAQNKTWFDRAQWYRWNGSSFVAIGSTADFTAASEENTNGHFDGEGQWEPGYNASYPGSLSNSQTYAGTASGANKFRLYCWHLGTSSDTTRSMSLSGQVSATAA